MKKTTNMVGIMSPKSDAASRVGFVEDQTVSQFHNNTQSA